MISKILVALDGSETAKKSVEYAPGSKSFYTIEGRQQEQRWKRYLQ
jgi:hypothetical protein